MKWLMGLLFGTQLDQMADEVVADFVRTSHCWRCGRCVCRQHSALADDTWEEHRVVCRICASQLARRYAIP